MLSESERQIILQHREQKLQRQQSWKNRLKPSLNHSITDKESIPGSQSGFWGWKNVAVELEDGLNRPNRNDSRQVELQRGSKHKNRACCETEIRATKVALKGQS